MPRKNSILCAEPGARFKPPVKLRLQKLGEYSGWCPLGFRVVVVVLYDANGIDDFHKNSETNQKKREKKHSIQYG